MSYDVYYSTGGGDLIYGGSDVWVNHWIDNVAPKLKHPSKLMIHRVRPATFQRNKIDNLESEIADIKENMNKYLSDLA